MKIFFLLMLFCVPVLHAQLAGEKLDSLLLLGKHQIAISLLNQQPQIASVFYQLGQVYHDKMDYFMAKQWYEKAAIASPTLKHRLKEAQMDIVLQHYHNAERNLKRLKEEHPEKEVIQQRLAKLYQRQFKFDKAIELYQRLVQKNSNKIDYFYSLGISHYAKKEYSKAIDHFLISHKKDSMHFNSVYQLAKAFYDLKLADSTYVFIKKGNQLRPDHKNLNRIYINQLRRDKRYNEAIKALTRQDSIFPNDFFNKKQLGVLHYKLNELKKAEQNLKLAIKLKPSDFKSFTYLGHIALKRKNFPEAFAFYFQASITDKISRDQEFYGLGVVSIAMDDLEKAQYFLERAYYENRLDASIVFELAKITDHNTKGGKDAYRYFQHYVTRFSDNNENTAYAKRRIREIKEVNFLKGQN